MSEQMERAHALGMTKYDRIRFCALIRSPWVTTCIAVHAHKVGVFGIRNFRGTCKLDETRDEDACWLWHGPKHFGGVRTRPTKPYGKFVFRHRVTGRRVWLRANRVAYLIIRGPIPNDPRTGKPLTLDHRPTCSTLCVNPYHEEPATNRANVQESNVRRAATRRARRMAA